MTSESTVVAAPRIQQRLSQVLAALAVLSGAFLLFLIQPVVGKIVTPQYGGVAQVWCVCLLFFQLTLLGGYGLSYGLSRLPLRVQGMAYLALMALTALTIQIPLGAAWAPSDWAQPLPSLLGNLAWRLAAPCMLLATVSATMQHWYARLNLGNPYPLYALSNIGSLGALMAYPALMEPTQTVGTTLALFQAGYWLLALLAMAMGVRVIRQAASVQASSAGSSVEPVSVQAVRLKDIAWWLMLSAAGVILFMSFTSHITHQIAPIPLLWIVPLGLYLLSFIVCFGRPAVYRPRLWILLGQALLASFLVFSFGVGPMLALAAAALFSLCMVCHGELYARRPHVTHLTLFYLVIALGGALGGSFVSLAAPMIFAGDQEFFLILLAMTLLMLYFLATHSTGPTVPWRKWVIRMASALIGAFMVILTVYPMLGLQKNRQLILATRNFYGSASVILHPKDQILELSNGRIIHGNQLIDPATKRFQMTPTTYYDQDSPLGWAEHFFRARLNGAPMRIGAIGLGAGTIAAYGQPGDRITFYEIDPKIREIAQTHFGFLKNSQAQVNVLMGDGRQSLQRQVPQQYDMIVVDAFSGDSIPVHLLTREAMAIYLRHLKPEGVLLIHITNQYVDLIPVINNLAIDQKLHSVMMQSPKPNANTGATKYAILSRSPWLYARLLDRNFLKAHTNLQFVSQQRFADTRVWTDDFSDVLSAVKAL